MRSLFLTVNVLLFGLLISLNTKSEGTSLPQNESVTNTRTFAAKGIIQEIKNSTIVIKHEAISNFMDAMTMPFKVKNEKDLTGLKVGDEILFQLHVSETESWVDQIIKVGTNALPQTKTSFEPATTVSALPGHPLLYYKFTNELGQAVSLDDFRGQAIAMTFFYTRCPLPEFCPRLSKNFQGAQQKLEAMTNAPGNWHFISVSFDPEIDTPQMLKAYGENYHYDPNHWSFLTGPPDKIAELAQLSGRSEEHT